MSVGADQLARWQSRLEDARTLAEAMYRASLNLKLDDFTRGDFARAVSRLHALEREIRDAWLEAIRKESA